MTCKDCIHYSVCFITDEDVEKEVGKFGCDDFKDKSRFVELPCNVGDITIKKDAFGDVCLARKVLTEDWSDDV